jgi:hypothetical protein
MSKREGVAISWLTMTPTSILNVVMYTIKLSTSFKFALKCRRFLSSLCVSQV